MANADMMVVGGGELRLRQSAARTAGKRSRAAVAKWALDRNGHLDATLAAMDGEQMQDEWAASRKNRLPTFTEVLSRRTRPPVDLFMF